MQVKIYIVQNDLNHSLNNATKWLTKNSPWTLRTSLFSVCFMLARVGRYFLHGITQPHHDFERMFFLGAEFANCSAELGRTYSRYWGHECLFLGHILWEKRTFCLLTLSKQMSFLTISNENIFFTAQGTILGVIATPNKGLEEALLGSMIFVVFSFLQHHQSPNF